MEPDYLNDLLDEVLVCACNVLNESGLSECGCPCRLFVSAGPPVWDEACCSDGQLTVHLEWLYPFNNFPAQSSGVNLCQTPIAVDIVVTLLRCYPTVQDNGAAPTPGTLQDASEQVYRDMYILTNGLICCLKTHGRKRKFVMREVRVLGPQGGCIGTELRFTIEISDPI